MLRGHSVRKVENPCFQGLGTARVNSPVGEVSKEGSAWDDSGTAADRKVPAVP